MTTVTCGTTFATGKYAEISINIKTCRSKPSVTFSIKFDALNVDWTKTFENSVEVSIPGVSLSGIGGMYLEVTIDGRSIDDVYFKV